MASHGEVVIDTNVVGGWCFNEPDKPLAPAVRACVVGGDVKWVAPDLFWAEFQHLCRNKHYQDGVSWEDCLEHYAGTMELPRTDVPGILEECRDQAWEYIARLGLGSYDAYFLCLAVNLNLPIWTCDDPFYRICQRDPAMARFVLKLGVDITP